MNFIQAISAYEPNNEQEASDQALILKFANDYGQTLLTRENGIAHMTASSIILNEAMDQMLMIHHNIYNTWTWTGGHTDGDEDLYAVALKEAREETGLKNLRPLTKDIASVDILPVWGHIKRGKYVSAHLHLNAAFVFVADPMDMLILNEQETSGLMWVPLEEVADKSQEPQIIEVYENLIQFAKRTIGEQRR